MSIVLKIELMVIAIIYLLFILYSVKKRKMDLNYSLIWLFSGVVIVILAAIPNFIENLSKLLGFETASNMVFLYGIIVMFLILFNLTTIVTKQSRKITKLVQETSILAKKVEQLEKNK